MRNLMPTLALILAATNLQAASLDKLTKGEVVNGFHTLFDRKDAVYGKDLPGYNVKGRDVAGAEYFTIGPDKQLDAWEAYLKNAEGADTKLYRLYPRDFWMP